MNKAALEGRGLNPNFLVRIYAELEFVVQNILSTLSNGLAL
jgi:hypothetical protein